MEIEDLKSIWQNETKELEHKITLNHQLLKEASFGKIQHLLFSLKLNNIIELIVSLLFLPPLMIVCIDFSTQPAFLIPALILLIILVGGVFWNVMNIIELLNIQLHQSIIITQKKLERLKVWERREVISLYFIMPLVWICFITIFLIAVAHINIYELPNHLFLWNIAGTVLITTIVVGLLQIFPDKELAKAIDFIKVMEDLEE